MPTTADRLTIRDLAALLDVPPSTVYRWADEWEAGVRPGPKVYRDGLRPKRNRYFRAADVDEWRSASLVA
jgi:transposase-like protein